MTITKTKYLGKLVSMTWRDPGYARQSIQNALKGRAALASWTEYGIIDDITEGVVRLVHSAGKDPYSQETDEICFTVVDEALVESITVFEPVKEPTNG